MKALIDADILEWEFGTGTDSEGKLIPWPFVQSRVQARINGIMEATGADEYQLFLTSDDKSNFRYNVATIKPYKGNRKTEKPYYYNHIRNFLVDHRGAIEIFGMEADDAIGIAQYTDYMRAFHCIGENPENDHVDPRLCETIICSRDKDLRMIPGWHYSWGVGNQQEKPKRWINEHEAITNFYCQVLTGDTVDNIPGLFGVGKSSKLLAGIARCKCEFEMYELCLSEYQKRFGSYAEKFLDENCQLLWIKREESRGYEVPTKSKYFSKEIDCEEINSQETDLPW